MTDEWRAYSRIDQLGFTHETVNHQEFFINPINNANTQQIEAFWNRLRFRMVREMRHHLSRDPLSLQKYLSYYWFLSIYYNPIKKCYPPDLFEIYLRMLSIVYHL